MVWRTGLGALTAFVLAGWFISAAPAGGDDPEEAAKSKLKQFDKNKDGKLSMEEWPERELFKKADLNGDSFLNVEELFKLAKSFQEGKHRKDGEGKDRPRKDGEGKNRPHKDGEGKDRPKDGEKKDWAKHREAEGKEIFGRIERNYDGKLSWEEAKAAAKKMDWKLNPQDFDAADTNQDGFVGKEEFFKFFMGQHEDGEKRDEHADREKEDQRKKEERAKYEKEHEARAKIERQAKERVGFHLKEYDEDKDGKLSVEEWQEGEDSFDNWDKNGDGYLGREELFGFFRSQLLKKSGMTEQEKE